MLSLRCAIFRLLGPAWANLLTMYHYWALADGLPHCKIASCEIWSFLSIGSIKKGAYNLPDDGIHKWTFKSSRKEYVLSSTDMIIDQNKRLQCIKKPDNNCICLATRNQTSVQVQVKFCTFRNSIFEYLCSIVGMKLSYQLTAFYQRSEQLKDEHVQVVHHKRFFSIKPKSFTSFNKISPVVITAGIFIFVMSLKIWKFQYSYMPISAIKLGRTILKCRIHLLNYALQIHFAPPWKHLPKATCQRYHVDKYSTALFATFIFLLLKRYKARLSCYEGKYCSTVHWSQAPRNLHSSECK